MAKPRLLRRAANQHSTNTDGRHPDSLSYNVSKQAAALLVAYKQNAAGGVAGKVVQMTGNIQLSVTIKCNFEVLHYTFKDFYI